MRLARHTWRSKPTLLLLLLTPMVLSACDRGDDPAPSNATQAPNEQMPGGTLVVAIQSDGKSLDPHAVTDAASMRLLENMYNTLMRYTPRYGEVAPELAESYDVSENGRTFTFTLRDGPTFHSGRPVTASDVKASVERIIDSKMRADHFAAVDRVEVINPRTVAFHLTRPDAAFLTHLAHPMNAIVDTAVIDDHADLTSVDAGSGPFKLVEWRKDHELVLQRHEAYHVPGQPLLDRIVFRAIPDETSRSIAIRTGQVDLVLDVPEKDIMLMERANDVVVRSVPGTFWEYIGLNCSRTPFDDVRVRQAIAWAIDRSQLNRLVKLGHAVPITGGHIPATHWADADLDIYPMRDTQRAGTLLADAGYADGFDMTLVVGSSFPYQIRAAEVIKQQLADVNIRVDLQTMESTVFFAKLGQRDFDAVVVGWVGFVDPDQWTYNIFHSEGRYNQQQYSNAAVDRLLERGRQTLDRRRRVELYRDAQRLIATDAPLIFLYLNPQTSAWRRDVQGYVVHPTATTRWLRDTWIAR